MIDQPSSRMVFRLDILCRSLFYVFLFFASLVTVHYSIGGIRLNPSEMVGVVFGLVVLFHLVFLGKVRVEHKRLVVIPIVLYFFCFLSECLSSVTVLMSPGSGSIVQVLKLLVFSFVTKFILICFLLYQSTRRFRDSQNFLFFFSAALAASSIYQFAFLYLGIFRDINLDQLVWPKLTFGAWFYDVESLRYGLGDKGFTFRHGGFAVNPNFLAAQLTCAIPLFFFLSYFKGFRFIPVLILLVMSMIVTLSRSGLAALFVILFLGSFSLLTNDMRRVVSVALSAGIVIFVGAIFYQAFPDAQFFQLAKASLNRFTLESYSNNPRAGLVLAGLDMWSQNPIFGVGIGNSAFLLKNFAIVNSTGHSLHNYWLMLIVEQGLLSICYFLLFFFFLLMGNRLRNLYGQSLFLSIIGLTVIGLFNTSVGSVQIQMFIILLYCSAIQQTSIAEGANTSAG